MITKKEIENIGFEIRNEEENYMDFERSPFLVSIFSSPYLVMIWKNDFIVYNGKPDSIESLERILTSL